MVRSQWSAVAVLLAVFIVTLSQGQREQDDDDNKPYKFGFSIDKYQHRLEEKDAKGIVKGEYGFVTGDGVYHETSYATDEKGDFKILGMRNYFVGLPGLDLPDITKGANAAAAPAPTTPAPAAPKPVAASILSGIMGCSGCTIPDPSSSPPGAPLTSLSAPEASGVSSPPSAFGSPATGAPSAPLAGPPGPPGPTGPPEVPPAGAALTYPTASRPPAGPLAPSAETPSNTKGVFSRAGGAGGPPTLDDVLRLLYRFNYTVGFHGHHEEGDAQGGKRGGYFSNGRDGLARVVTYTADERGYHPNVTLLQLSAADTPREDTERGEEFGLKGYEFEWFSNSTR